MSGRLQSVHNCSVRKKCTIVETADLTWFGSTEPNTRNQMETLVVEHDIEETTSSHDLDPFHDEEWQQAHGSHQRPVFHR